MTPEQWEEVGRVFDAVAALPPEERASFLDQACGENESLRREVRALLEIEGQAGDFLGGAALEDVAGTVGVWVETEAEPCKASSAKARSVAE